MPLNQLGHHKQGTAGSQRSLWAHGCNFLLKAEKARDAGEESSSSGELRVALEGTPARGPGRSASRGARIWRACALSTP